MLASISVNGFRGFSDQQTLTLALPNGARGGGLTILVGPNSGGKSSIIEALTAATHPNHSPPSFTEGMRNRTAESRVEISITDNTGKKRVLKTIQPGGAEAEFSGEDITPQVDQIYVLPSRRVFSPYFQKSDSTRESYITNNQQLPSQRAGQHDLAQRIFHMNGNPDKREKFQSVLSEVLNPAPKWTLE